MTAYLLKDLPAGDIVPIDYANGFEFGLLMKSFPSEKCDALFGSRCYGTDKTAPFTFALQAARDQHEFMRGIEDAKYGRRRSRS